MSAQKRHSKAKAKTSKGSGDLPEKADSMEVHKTLSQTQTSSNNDNKNQSHQEVPTDKPKTEEGNQRVQKSREEVMAEREAKKLAKAMKKKGKVPGNIDKVELQPKKVASTPSEKINVQDKENICAKPQGETKSPMTKSDGGEGVRPAEDGEKCEGKSKAQLRAERRAVQEAQRAKKVEAAKEKSNKGPEGNVAEVTKPVQVKVNVTTAKALTPQSQDKVHKVKLFAHLYTELIDCTQMDLCEDIHPSIVRLGTQYRSKVISGANARCLALLNAFRTVVSDYKTAPNQELSRGLEAEITKSMAFLNKCRPVGVSMVNAVKHLRFQVNQLKGNDVEWRQQIYDWMDTYIKEQIEKAAEAISLSVLQKITDGDVILTYSCSSLVQRTLIKANEAKIKFRVIVVDSRPWLEGKEMLRRLVKAGIRCTYVFFNGLSFIMPEVSKILLGAHALLANGYVMSRAGSSQIALLAKKYNVPVLVCCETHKFSEKVQTDSFVHNELGDPDELIARRRPTKELSKWRSIQYLTPLNLTYDVTPPDLVSAVVTEIAVLPCTSVPVILRVKPPDVTC